MCVISQNNQLSFELRSSDDGSGVFVLTAVPEPTSFLQATVGLMPAPGAAGHRVRQFCDKPVSETVFQTHRRGGNDSPCRIHRVGGLGAFTLIAAALSLLTFASPRVVAATAKFIPLGDLPGGIFFSSAVGISADGRVVVGGGSVPPPPGSIFSTEEAFRWTESGKGVSSS